MPDASGNFKGLSVPRVPWHEDPRLGERYGIWTFDDQIYVTFTVESFGDGWVTGVDDEGRPVGCGIAALRTRAKKL